MILLVWHLVINRKRVMQSQTSAWVVKVILYRRIPTHFLNKHGEIAYMYRSLASWGI